jgi:hypothetical protein
MMTTGQHCTIRLNGKVKVWTLPEVRPPADPSLLKRVLLPQGTLSQFHNGSPAIHYIAAFDLVLGGVRGNHYHKRKQEYVYLLHGSISLVIRDLASGQEDTLAMHEGDLALIETEVVHALVPLKAGLGVEFSPAPFDPEDIFKVQLA